MLDLLPCVLSIAFGDFRRKHGVLQRSAASTLHRLVRKVYVNHLGVRVIRVNWFKRKREFAIWRITRNRLQNLFLGCIDADVCKSLLVGSYWKAIDEIYVLLHRSGLTISARIIPNVLLCLLNITKMILMFEFFQ